MLGVESVLSIIAPHHCLGCNREGSLLCHWCYPDVFEDISPRCYHCNRFSSDAGTCDSCRGRNRPKSLWVGAIYDGVAKQLVYALKFSRARAAAKIMATRLDEIVPAFSDAWVIVHVPTATSRRRQRGYDQSELIAQELARLRLVKHQTLLARQGQQRQVGASKKQRAQQMKQAFYCPSPELVKNKTILLVDDLVTTGATIESATKTLKKAGAKQVFAAAFAQKAQ